MALSFTTSYGAELRATDYLTPSLVNSLLRGITVSVTGTVGTADITAGAIDATLVKPDAYFYAAGTWAANVYTVTLSPAPTGYVTGMEIAFKTSAANTGAVDVDLNGFGAKDLLKQDGSEFASGEIPSGAVVVARYDGTQFKAISPTTVQNLAVPGTMTVTGASTFNGAMTLGDAAGDTLTFNGTFAGSPTITSKATPIAADLVMIQDSAASNAWKQSTIAAVQAAGLYTSANTAVPATGSLTPFPHGLTAVPSRVRVVLVCTTTDLGYSVGMEVDIASLFTQSGTSELASFTVISDATNVSLQRSSTAGIYINRISATAGAPFTITESSWRVKVYARL